MMWDQISKNKRSYEKRNNELKERGVAERVQLIVGWQKTEYFQVQLSSGEAISNLEQT